MFLLVILLIFIWSAVMTENCKAPETLAQTPLGGFTYLPPTALRNFHYVKIINALYGLCCSKV